MNQKSERYERINKWLGDIGVLNIGDKIVEAMVEAGLITDPADLYTITEPELTDMPFGKSVFGVKRARNVIAAMNKVTTVPLNNFLGALGIKGLGEGIARNVREKAAGEFDKVADWVHPTKLLEAKDRVSLPNIAGDIVKGLQASRSLISRLQGLITVVEGSEAPPAPADSGKWPLTGMVFCLTGSFPEKKSVYHAQIIDAGGLWEEDVRDNVTAVVVNEMAAPGKETGKAAKAKKKGVTIMTLGDLQEVIKAGVVFKEYHEKVGSKLPPTQPLDMKKVDDLLAESADHLTDKEVEALVEEEEGYPQ